MRVIVSCVLKFTLAANSGAQTSQFGSGGLISYCSRIRKNITYRIRKNVTENRQRIEKPINEATIMLYQWNAGWNRPILATKEVQQK